MLPLKNRLKKKNDFDNVFKSGKGCKEDFLYIKYAKNNLLDSRFGFVISKKVSSKAVIRNKIKRQLRSIIGIRVPDIKKGLDVVIRVIPGLQVSDYWELEGKMNNLLKKARITVK